MLTNRRAFLAGSTAAGLMACASQAQAAPKPTIRAIAFDAFPIFDPRPVSALVEQLFPGKGADLNNSWRTRQFEYTWLRSMGGRYKDFWSVTEEALVFAAKTLQLELTAEKRVRLMQAYLELKPWPDVAPALASLKAAGIRLAFLSNFTPGMLNAGIKNGGLEGTFEHILSTDRAKTYKPAPHAYQMGMEAFKLRREEILFAAFAGWDAAGAKWFGYPTFWVNRLHSPAEELDVAPDGAGANLADLVTFVIG
ncbi:MAG TPA: haloacid dehalogenase type II [Chthonomonadaceae bacterium]|nr:haloacid dehalogenase type II [Chthonomonadaceae bacterium]